MTINEVGIMHLQVAERPITIGEMVVADYRKAAIFRKFELDYCCGGKRSLEEACQKKGLDAQLVQLELDAVITSREETSHDYGEWTLDALAAYIVAHHHLYVVESLPMLYELTAKVARVHGERHPELVKIHQIFNAVAAELDAHMRKEEHMLFPYITRMAIAQASGSSMPAQIFGSVKHPIQMMESEHVSAGDGMANIRFLSRQYTPPADACTSYRVLYAKLQEFERDLHQHVHLENNILFPKAIAMEESK
jgi:regulator of cell morphogenesis and NO signaling